MGTRPTLQQIALLAGTSKSTVSRVLTGKGYAAPEIRERVLAAAKASGYSPRPAAKKKRIDDMILIIASALDSEVQVQLANAIIGFLRLKGMKAVIASVPFGSDTLLDYIRYAGERGFGGIIALGMLDTPPMRRLMRTLPFPVVLLGQTIEGISASRIVMQDYEGGYRATSYLLDMGHRQIALLSGYDNAAAIADRERGYCDALADAGILADGIHIAYKGFDQKSGSDFADECIAAGLPYTAVIATCDLLAAGFVLRLRERGVRVPEDVSVVCFDDTLSVRICQPPLTVVRYDFEQMGQALAELMSERVLSPQKPPRCVTFAPTMITRGSVAPPQTR